MNDARLIRELLDEIERQSGWRVRRATGRGHNTVFPPDGKKIIQVACTPSDYRWRKNLRSELRRAGWDGTLLD